jgi:ABC-2 type transport system ATP-binding protein
MALCTGSRAGKRGSVLLRSWNDSVSMIGKMIRCGLSGGLRRRVEIARALLRRPKLLIVDEATAGLDVAGRQLLLTHVRSLCRRGLSVLWATHMLGEVEPSDQLIILHQGNVRWEGEACDFAPDGALEAAFLKITGRSA